jgi:methyl-accepting chemotaxis protein
MVNIRDTRVGVRLSVAFGTVGLLLVVVVAVGLWGANSQANAEDDIVRAATTIERALDLKYEAANFNGNQNAYALDIVHEVANAADDSVGNRALFLESLAKFRADLGALEATDLTDSERAEITVLAERVDSFAEIDNQAIALFREGTPASLDAAVELVLVDATAVFSDIAASLDRLTTEAADVLAAREQDASNTADRAQLIMVVVGLVALVLALVLARVITRSLTAPLQRTVALLQSVATGDFTQRVDSAGDDEVGQMGDALNHTLDRMSETLAHIAGGASTLSASSEELSAVSQQMSAGAEETAAQAATVSAAAEQVSHNVQSVSAGAEELDASIQEIAKNTSDAARVASGAVSLAEATNETVAKLGESAAEIGEVIKVITSIAEQTNLLALNATIEAARAGEAGKGFAVVASEVKDLARKTARSSEEIERKIGTIQHDTEHAVAAIGQIRDVIREINDIQTIIAASVEEQAATTSEIGRSVTEAATGSTEIARNITGVAETAQGNSQGAADTHRAAEELARLSGELLQLVAQFRLGDRPSPIPPLQASISGPNGTSGNGYRVPAASGVHGS